MPKTLPHQPGPARSVQRSTGTRRSTDREELPVVRARIRAAVSEVRILDPGLARELIRQRQERDLDQYDEVWNGVYVVPPLPTNPHQDLVGDLFVILHTVVKRKRRGQVLPGANVSDRQAGWEHNFRGPDIVVVLHDGRAVDCFSHWMGGPDFLVEVKSPGDETEEKIPFYSQLQVRELLLLDGETRELRLYRHNGQELAPMEPTDFRGRKWLVSAVVPLAFRRRVLRDGPRTEVQRTDRTPGKWLV